MTQTPSIKPMALRDEERQPCEVWTRVMGYHRPMSSFNIGKKGEFAERVCFSVAPATEPCAMEQQPVGD